LPFCQETIHAKRAKVSTYLRQIKRYPDEPKVIGEHLRKHRLDLGWRQKAVARLLNVHVGSINNWERGIGVPRPRQLAGIIKFLGYDPNPVGASFAEKLKHIRRANGWTQEEFAKKLRINPQTLWRWERGAIPLRKSMAKLDGMLNCSGFSLG
jgi:transcriptional regulator with XRE-family HTH domain